MTIKLKDGKLYRGNEEVFYSELSYAELNQLENITNALYTELIPKQQRSYSGRTFYDNELDRLEVNSDCSCPDIDIPKEWLEMGGNRLTVLIKHQLNYSLAAAELGITVNAMSTWFHRFKKRVTVL